MNNQMTDQLRLVQTELVKAIPAFGRTIVAVENYSFEVFRGEYHLGSVRTPGSGLRSNNVQDSQKMKVFSGDIIFWVSLVSQPVSISGNFTTKDKYVRIYDITIDFVVSDPTLFVQGYRMGKDPVSFAIELCKTSLRKYASRYEHDKLVPLERVSDEWNTGLCANTGMRVMQLSRWSLRDDPKREEKFAIQQESEIQKLKDRLERERVEVQRAFEREQEMLQHMHDLHYRLRETAAQELMVILRERIRDTFERGAQIDEVAEDSMKLLNAFHESLHKGSIVDSSLSNVASTGINGISPKKDAAERDDPETDPLTQTPADLTDLSRMRDGDAEESSFKND